MKQKLIQSFTYLFRIASGLISTILLFLILPMINVVFRSYDSMQSQHTANIANVVKLAQEDKKEKKITERKIRNISLEPSKSMQREISSKFTPDLSIGGEGNEGLFISKQNLDNIVYEEGQTDQNVVLQYSIAPVYPIKAKSNNIEGTVSVIILIDRNGRVANIDFEKLPDAVFRQPVRDAVLKWKFKPACHKGIPVNIRLRQSFDFRMDN